MPIARHISIQFCTQDLQVEAAGSFEYFAIGYLTLKYGAYQVPEVWLFISLCIGKGSLKEDWRLLDIFMCDGDSNVL